MKKEKRKVLIGTLISFLIPLIVTLLKFSIYFNAKKEGYYSEPFIDKETYIGFGVLLSQSSGVYIPEFWDLVFYCGITIVVPIFTYFILKHLSET